MELKIEYAQIPEAIHFNYDELKNELTEKVHMYETLVYGEEQIKEAKADRASLNRFKKALNDERIRREKEYLKPFNEFKAQIAELVAIIDKPIAVIDAQVKDYEAKKRDEKNEAIVALWDSREGKPDWLKLVMIFDASWLNASTSMKAIGDAIDAKLAQVQSDLDTLAKLPLFCFEATEEYKHSLDLNRAIAEGQRLADIQRRKLEQADAQKQAQAQPAQPAKTLEQDLQETPATWISFSALINVAQARELKAFFEARNIQFKAI